MNKYVLICLLLLICGCTASVNNENNESMTEVSSVNNSESFGPVNLLLYDTQSPISVFSTTDINLLGVNCSGSDYVIASCIKSWQSHNMVYAGQSLGKAESSDSIRWNYMLPGIFPSNEIIREHVYEGKVYGVCFDYAVIFCSIANYYNLSCRVSNSLSKPSDHDSSIVFTTGMAYDEYLRLKVKLEEKNYSYSYDSMRSIAEETPEHYWAEVLIGDEWVVYDASGPNGNPDYDTQANYKDVNDWEVTNWSSRDPNSKISQDVLVDDLGDTNRVSSIGDYMMAVQSGRIGVAPYFEDCFSVCDFFENSIPMCELNCNMDASYVSCYESCSDDPFYKVCDFICGNEPDFESCYETCSGKALNSDCDNNC